MTYGKNTIDFFKKKKIYMCDLTSSIAIKRNKIKKKLFEILRSLKYKNYDNWMIEKILEKI